MIRLRLQFLALCAALVASGTASADIYTYVQNGRTSIVFSDTPPLDGRYKLYKKDRVQQGSIRPVQIYGSVTRARYSSQVLAAAQETKVDPALIGGLIVKVGSRMLDGSLRTKLNSLKLAMKEVG